MVDSQCYPLFNSTPHFYSFTGKKNRHPILFAIFEVMKLDEEQKIVGYSSLAAAILVNLPKLSFLREHTLLSRFGVFDPLEFLFQFGYTFLFCFSVFRLNLHWLPRRKAIPAPTKARFYPWSNAAFLLIACIIGSFTQRHLFKIQIPLTLYRGTYFIRLGLCMLLELLIIRIVYLLRVAKAKELETEQIKSRVLGTELELLKQQLNPHFFFNSLSTLSGIVRESPDKAQHFIKHLSRIFRNLLQANEPAIPLREEVQALLSYIELLNMRFEQGIQVTIDLPPQYMDRKVPHLSLQPLIENAAKYNIATIASPLHIRIYAANEYLFIENNLQPVRFPEASPGLGLFNLNERFKILAKQEIIITRSNTHFMVQLPFVP